MQPVIGLAFKDYQLLIKGPSSEIASRFLPLPWQRMILWLDLILTSLGGLANMAGVWAFIATGLVILYNHFLTSTQITEQYVRQLL